MVLAAADGSNHHQTAAALKIPPITAGMRPSFALPGLEGLRDAPRSGPSPKHDSGTRHPAGHAKGRVTQVCTIFVAI